MFPIAIFVLAILACSWIIWDLRWRGVYIVAVMIAAIFIERWSSSTGWISLVVVATFVLVATLLGFRIFGAGATRNQ